MNVAQDFLDQVWDGLPDGPAIQIWNRKSKQTHFFTDTSKAAKHASSIKGEDVYMAAGLAAKALTPRKTRARADEVVGIPGLWADIDINGGPDHKTGVAPDRESALELASWIIEPTLIVNSGHGIQPWWLFEDGVWIFGSEDEREQAQRLVAAFQASLKAKAAQDGWSIDSTFDLARLMRLPGTENCKGLEAGFEPAPVELFDHEGARHSLPTVGAVVEAYMGEAIEATKRTSGEGLKVVVDWARKPDLEKLEGIRDNDLDFNAVWMRKSNNKTKNWSASEFEMSIASYLVGYGWEDQEVVDALVYWRLKQEPGDPKNKIREARIKATVGRARSDSQSREMRENAEFERDLAIDTLQEIGRAPASVITPGQKEQARTLFSRVIGGPQIKELHQDGNDPEFARFRLILADGREVLLGKASEFTRQESFRNRFMVVTQHYPRKVKMLAWDDVVAALVKAAQLNVGKADSRVALVAAWVEEYFERRGSTDKEMAVANKLPFQTDDDGMCLYLEDFLMFVRKNRGEKIERADLQSNIKIAGFEQKAINYYPTEGKRSSRSYWCLPMDAASELLDG